MVLQYFGMCAQPHSWALVAESILLEFQKRGIELKIKSTNGPNGVHPLLMSSIVPFPDPLETETSFSYTLPKNLHKINAKNKIQIYNYETTLIPPDYAKLMNEQASLILPSSNFAKEIFVKNGVAPEKMVVVPHGHNPLVFNNQVAATSINGIDNNKFKFLCVAAPHWRKGIDVLFRAYIEEFKNEEDVVLVLKTSMNSHEGPAHFHININNLIKEFQNKYKFKWPEIKFITTRVPNLASLYRWANVMVLPSRAECFSLTPLEAAACQVPIITTNYGGQLDFLNSKNSFLIDYKLTKAPKQMQYHYFQPNSMMGEPNISHLRQIMRHVKNNYKDAQAKAKLAHQQTQHLTWSFVAQQILDLINERQWKI